MASPIGYLIHPPDPPDPSPPHAPPQKPLPGFDASATLGIPIQSADGSRSRGIVTPSAVPSADAAVATSALSTGPAAQQPAGSHSKTPSLYQCAECLRITPSADSPFWLVAGLLTLAAISGRYSRPEHLQVSSPVVNSLPLAHVADLIRDILPLTRLESASFVMRVSPCRLS
jgi:hypothetical protein